MNAPIVFVALEREAWTANYQDSPWDIYLGYLLLLQGLMPPLLAGMENRWPGYAFYVDLMGGGLVLIPGLVLFVRFFRQHPLLPDEVEHGQPGS